jgi:hypothetical protein
MSDFQPSFENMAAEVDQGVRAEDDLDRTQSTMTEVHKTETDALLLAKAQEYVHKGKEAQLKGDTQTLNAINQQILDDQEMVVFMRDKGIKIEGLQETQVVDQKEKPKQDEDKDDKKEEPQKEHSELAELNIHDLLENEMADVDHLGTIKGFLMVFTENTDRLTLPGQKMIADYLKANYPNLKEKWGRIGLDRDIRPDKDNLDFQYWMNTVVAASTPETADGQHTIPTLEDFVDNLPDMPVEMRNATARLLEPIIESYKQRAQEELNALTKRARNDVFTSLRMGRIPSDIGLNEIKKNFRYYNKFRLWISLEDIDRSAQPAYDTLVKVVKVRRKFESFLSNEPQTEDLSREGVIKFITEQGESADDPQLRAAEIDYFDREMRERYSRAYKLNASLTR